MLTLCQINIEFEIVDDMKNFIYTAIFVLFAFCSCKRQNEAVTLPVDKLYILEYNFALPKENEEFRIKFYVAGFCELDKNFNVRYARQLFYNSDYYSNSRDIVPDSLRSKISNVLLKYQTDTTFQYPGEPMNRIYDGNAYRFIIQKDNQKDITIKFEPEYLPEDLKFVYSYLYKYREKTGHKSAYSELFEMFKDQVKDDELLLPPLKRK